MNVSTQNVLRMRYHRLQCYANWITGASSHFTFFHFRFALPRCSTRVDQ